MAIRKSSTFAEMKRVYLFMVFACLCCGLCAQPKQEVRAVWLTSVFNLDWPKEKDVVSTSEDIRQQKKDLDRILDQLADTHINMVFLQTRLRGDVIYPSEIEPWSCFIKTNRVNTDYDPLAYAIEACHKRGMECHAWLVV
jgi:uncharacterized lipoprotein YddW (UPF0748 family)